MDFFGLDDDAFKFTYSDPDGYEGVIKILCDADNYGISLDLENPYDMNMFYKMIKIITEEVDTNLEYYDDEFNNTIEDEEYKNEAAIDIDSE